MCSNVFLHAQRSVCVNIVVCLQICCTKKPVNFSGTYFLQLAAKFAGVSTEEELMAAIEALSFEEKRQLGLPDLEPVVLTPKELKQAVAELKQQ